MPRNETVTLPTVPAVELREYCIGCELIAPGVSGRLLGRPLSELHGIKVGCIHAKACEQMRRRRIGVPRKERE